MGGPGSGRKKGSRNKRTEGSYKSLQKKGGIAEIAQTGAARAKGWKTRKMVKAAIRSRRHLNK